MTQLKDTSGGNQLIRVLFFGLAFILVSLLVKYWTALPFDQFLSTLSTASIVMLFGLAGLYFYAAAFYSDLFYKYLSLGWLATAIVVLFESTSPIPIDSLTYSLTFHGLAIISVIPFYLGSFIPINEPTPRRKFLLSLLVWSGWLIGTYLLCYWLVFIKFPDTDMGKQYLTLTLGGVLFTSWTLVRVGRCFKARLEPAGHGRWSVLLPLTFYLYAALQPLTLIRLVPTMRGVILFAFFFSMTIKVINMLGILSILRTDLIRIKEHSVKLQERAEHRSELEELGALAASIEHDLRSPLAIINVEIDLMERKLQAHPEILATFERVKEQTRRIYAATKVVSILRGSKDYYERLLEKIDVSELIRRSIKTVKMEMDIKDVKFISERKILYIKANRSMLEQAFVNILKNSVEAIHSAQRERGLVSISVGKDFSTEKTIRVVIKDNGSGIPEEDIPKLATLFTTKIGSHPNSGIGLFITNKIIKVHGGKLLIESKVGEGTAVSLLLPEWEVD